MLFWIFVIIGILGAGVMIWAAAYTPKEVAEYEQLQEEYDRLDEAYDRYHYYTAYGSEEAKKAREARNAAYSKKMHYKEQHPNLDNKISRQETLRLVGTGVLIGAAVIVGIMLFALAIIYIDAPAEYASKQAEYEVFSWEVENDVYAADDDVVGRKELYSDVRNWNKNIAHKKAKANDFWVGIFVPDYYNDLQLIELN
jgi:hypothetical protein